MEGWIFRPMRPEEAKEHFALVRRRMRWMDEAGIRHWNAFRYDEVYPLGYYEEMQRAGACWTLMDRAGRLLCAGILLEEDESWEDRAPALYVHNLASNPDAPGAGALFLREAENLARSMGKSWLRLDCAEDSEKLNAYYEALGFEAAGQCQDGPYRGVLRQKRMGEEPCFR